MIGSVRHREKRQLVTQEQLSEVFDRGLRFGVESLSPLEMEVFRIQDFIIEYEMGGLSGYLYNRLPDLAGIEATVAAMRQHGITELAALLNEAMSLFAGYADPNTPTTWESVCQYYDPHGRVDDLDRQIGMLPDYGI